MVGIAALGAAFGGLSKGYMEGEKHRSEMEDADQRRELGRAQLKQVKREESYQEELANLYKDGLASESQPTQTGGIAKPGDVQPPAPAPVVDGVGVPASGEPMPKSTGAIAAPGQPSAAPKSAVSSIGAMQSAIERRQQLDLKYGKINEVQALQMMKNYKQLQQEGVIEGLNYYQQSGDRAGAIERINATGSMKLDPNAQFKIEEREVAPGVKLPNVVVTSPDGAHSFNQYDALVGSLNPKDALNFKFETGYKIADLTLKKTAEENLNSYRQGTLSNQRLQFGELVRHHQALEKESTARLAALTGAKELEQRERASKTALTTILQSNGISKEMTADKLDMLPAAQQAAYRKKVDESMTAHAIWSMNLTPDNKEGITSAEALQIIRNAASIKQDQIKYDANGYGFIPYRGKEVYMPGLYKAPAQDGAAPAPQSGVTPPGASSPPAAGPAAGPSAGPAATPAPGSNRGVALPVDKALRSTDGGRSYFLDIPQTIRDPKVAYYREIPNPVFQAIGNKKFASRADAQAAYAAAGGN